MANDGSLPVDPKVSMVRGIFSKIADSYGTFNAVSSLGIYRSWLKVLAETAAYTADEKVLDVAGGTGEKSMLLPCWASGKMVSQEIRLPASWGEGVR